MQRHGLCFPLPRTKPGFAGKMGPLLRDTPYGCKMRSRFWLGLFQENDVPNIPDVRQEAFPDSFGYGLFNHCPEEMSLLATFLPGLYAEHNRGSREV